MKLPITSADMLSFLNAFFGFLAIIFSSEKSFFYAAIFMIAAVVMDMADGRVARFSKNSNEMGKNIDSLADVVSFGIAPAFFFYMMISDFGIVAYLPFLLVIGGIYRLARFNISKSDCFIGMPITANGFIIPFFYFLNFLNIYTIIVLSFVLSVGMVSRIKIRKL